MSITGKYIIPSDNSYQLNLSDGVKSEDYLAGSSIHEPKICKIVSEPFDIIINVLSLKEPQSCKMILVECSNKVYMTLYNDKNEVFDNVQNAFGVLSNISFEDLSEHMYFD